VLQSVKRTFFISLTSLSLGLHVLKTVNNDDDDDMSYQEFEDLMYFHSVASDEEKAKCKLGSPSSCFMIFLVVYKLHDLDNSGIVDRHEFTELARKVLDGPAWTFILDRKYDFFYKLLKFSSNITASD
jgi:hypothetical protein